MIDDASLMDGPLPSFVAVKREKGGGKVSKKMPGGYIARV